ncbi:MAG: hypothetical protein M1828_000054 [Chrysothrix sp. TS-e1954]|nr:MAG: hypothetical protein M1828_000054 [Chrysothrix sp. TS-e1954]
MYEHGGAYNSDNETETSDAWDALSYQSGNIALDDDYVAQMKLPTSQRFPWDHSKGLYFVNGHHQLHCLKLLRKSFLELAEQTPLTVPWEHNMHCFNAIRQEIMCTADDTPRSTNTDSPGRIGVGQYRQCRDWDKLESWAKERWSCWKPINPREDIDTLLRYRYCPPESPYYERIHAIYGDFEMGENASAYT